MSTGGTLFWTAIVVAGVAWLAPSLDVVSRSASRGDSPLSIDSPAPDASDAASAEKSEEAHALVRSPDGHFYAEAQVNGARIRFMVDTGASVVALTPDDARRAGIVPGAERATARGAGGEIPVAPITIDRMELGRIDQSDVRAVVADALPVSLLGQSFLSGVDSVEIKDDRMILR